MKTPISVFAFFFAIASIVACSGGESAQLTQARTIQETMVKAKSNLDSTLDLKLEELGKQLTELSADSTLATDSTKMAAYADLKSKYSDVEGMKSKLADWMSNSKMLPSLEDLSKGIENPFGKDAKDEDILKAIQGNQESFNELKSEIETAIQ